MDKLEALPVLYVRATNHYDVGKTIGSSFKHWIKDYMETSDDVKLFRNYYDTSHGNEVVTNYLSTSEKYHAKIVSEIRGLADGSCQPFVDIFMLQIASEIQFCHAFEQPGIKAEGSITEDNKCTTKGCTDVLLNGQNHRVLGHNDDWTLDVASRVYIVHVTIDSDDVKEQFVSYMYPGYLPGFCFGMNKDLAITLNTVCPKEANPNGVPLMIMLRSLFTCTTIEECVAVMDSKTVGCAYGMTINIAEIRSTGMCCMEVYSDKDGSRVHVKHVQNEVESPGCSFYHHQNVYRHTENLNEGESESKSSNRRKNRIHQMEAPQNIDDVIAILGDDEIFEDPIFKNPNEVPSADAIKTSAMAVFDLTNKVMKVYRSNPRRSTSPLVKLPFL